jgi:hypothetical protein
MEISYSEKINAPIQKVWDALILKIEHPEFFVPNVSNVTIIEKTDNYVIRQMRIQNHEIEIDLIEKISATPFLVRFEIFSHPRFKGYVLNEAISINDKETELKYTMNWMDKETKKETNNLEILKSAVLLSKAFIENQ